MTTPLPLHPFRYADAAALGLSRRRIRDALESGELRKVVRGVYVHRDTVDTHLTRAAAVALVVAPTTVVCDRSAAWIHGVDVFGYADADVLPPVETCGLRRSARSRLDGVDGRIRDLMPDDVMAIGGMQITTPVRTALDLGCALGRHRALGALDQFMRVHDVTTLGMLASMPRYAGRRGVIQLRQLVPLASPLAESMRESWIRLDLHDAGLPHPVPQFWVEIDGRPTYRLDLAYPKHRIAIEYDGEAFHRRTPEQRERDRRRRAELELIGWRVIVVDRDGIKSDEWLGEVREALRSSTKRLRWTRTAY